jgi:cell volume regulation protein A
VSEDGGVRDVHQVVGNIEPFGLILLVVAGAGLLALFSNQISARLRIPAQAIFLIGAAVAAQLVPAQDRCRRLL